MGKRWTKLKREIVYRACDNVDESVERGRARYYPRWMARTEEVTGEPCTDVSQIKWDD